MDYDLHDKVLLTVCAVGLVVVLMDIFIWRF